MDEHAPIVYDITPYKEETRSWNDDPSAYLTRYYTKHYFLATAGKEQKGGSANIIDHLTGLEVIRGDQFVYQSPNKLCITGLAPTHPLLSQPDRYKVISLRFDPKILSCLPQPTAIPANSKKQPPPPCHCETVICKIEAQDLWATAAAATSSTSTSAKEVAATAPSAAAASLPPATLESTDSPSLSETPQAESVSEASTPSAISSPALESGSTTFKTTVDPTRVVFVVRGAISGHVIELNERLVRRDLKSEHITDPLVIQTMIEKASTHGFLAVIRPKVDKSEVALKDLMSMDDYDALRSSSSPNHLTEPSK